MSLHDSELQPLQRFYTLMADHRRPGLDVFIGSAALWSSQADTCDICCAAPHPTTSAKVWAFYPLGFSQLYSPPTRSPDRPARDRSPANLVPWHRNHSGGGGGGSSLADSSLLNPLIHQLIFTVFCRGLVFREWSQESGRSAAPPVFSRGGRTDETSWKKKRRATYAFSHKRGGTNACTCLYQCMIN